MALRGQRTKDHSSAIGWYDKLNLRHASVQEDMLRRALARDEQLQQADPDLWQRRECERLARHQEKEATNPRLRELGLSAIPLEPSGAQQRRKLRVLPARNEAEIARLRGEPIENGRHSAGTPLAFVRHSQQEEQ